MSVQLPAKYTAARQALMQARKVDEVKNIHDKAMAMRVYAEQAGDFELTGYAIEIRKRAERRLGEMMAEMPRAKVGEHKRFSKNPLPTLGDQGIDKNLADRARKAAAKSEKDFELDIEKTKARATNRKEPKAPKPKRAPRAPRPSSRRSVVIELNSLAWSNASSEKRAHFLQAIGPRSIWQAMSSETKTLMLELILAEKRNAPVVGTTDSHPTN